MSVIAISKKSLEVREPAFIDPKGEHCECCLHWIKNSERVGLSGPKVARCQNDHCGLVWGKVEKGSNKGKWVITKRTLTA